MVLTSSKVYYKINTNKEGSKHIHKNKEIRQNNATYVNYKIIKFNKHNRTKYIHSYLTVLIF